MREKLRNLVLAGSIVGSGGALAGCARQEPIPPLPSPDHTLMVSNNPIIKQTEEPIFIPPIDSEQTPENVVKNKPNIVILILDDIPAHDGRLFDKNLMPNIYSTFIEGGIDFRNYYVETPLCCPGRVGFLTGKHTHNHGVTDNDPQNFDFSDTFLTRLQEAGYYTLWTGKFLNNFHKLSDQTIDGVNEQVVFNGSNGAYFNYDLLETNGITSNFGNNPEDYSTDVIAQKTLQLLQTARPDQPILAVISPYSGHGPNIPSPKYAQDQRCNNLEDWSPPDYNEADVSDKPAYIQNFDPLRTDNFELSRICKTIRSVDDLVWFINNELERQGRADNTLFILTSDNGNAWGAHRWRGKSVPFATHIPFYASWRNGRGNSPKVEERYFSNIDLAPTLCELGGCSMSEADGISFDRLLKDQEFEQEREVILESMPESVIDEDGSARIPSWFSARTTERSKIGSFRYTEYGTGEVELYDASNGPCIEWQQGFSGDPCELNNRATDPSLELIRQELTEDLFELKNK